MKWKLDHYDASSPSPGEGCRGEDMCRYVNCMWFVVIMPAEIYSETKQKCLKNKYFYH